MRPYNAVKMALVLGAFLATGYTIYVYIGIVNRLSVPRKDQLKVESENDVHKDTQQGKKDDLPNSDKVDPDEYNPVLNPDSHEAADTQVSVCEMKRKCDSHKEIPLQVISGAANIIGPSICVNGEWLLSNSIGNVDRGMNIAVIDGGSGALKATKVFDLYGSESGPFKKFLQELGENDVLLVTTFDDATQKLRDDARAALADMGSQQAKSLTFRDNWIFVAGAKLKNSGIVYEKYLHSETEKNRFGNWPAAIVLEECLPRL